MLTITLNIDDADLERRLLQEAEAKGKSVEQLVLEIIEDHFKKIDDAANTDS